MKNVLFIYPTNYRVTGLPIGISSIIAVLIENNFSVKVFDTAFYPQERKENQNEIRSKIGMSKPVQNENQLVDNSTEIFSDLQNLINEYPPFLICFSILQPNLILSNQIAEFIKKKFRDITTIAGGIFAVLNPEFLIQNPNYDIVCTGEGEDPLLELCLKIQKKQNISKIKGLWIKKDGQIYKNPPSLLKKKDSLPFPDFNCFDNRLFYKPMQGKLYKMIPIETTRGCPYQCTYCSAPSLKKYYSKNKCGSYYRSFSMKYIVHQIEHQVKEYEPEFIYFSSETFLSMKLSEFEMFVDFYRDVKIPFWFQTRPETVTYKKIEKLKDIGMLWLTIGVEHGNEEFRKKILKRNYKNYKIIDCVKILKDLDMGASLNNIIGFPTETRGLIFDTINLNREMWEINQKLEFNVFIFTPYIGSDLYKLCKKLNLISDEFNFQQTHFDRLQSKGLNYSDAWIDELIGLSKTFNLYIKLPQSYFPQIKEIEQNSEYSNNLYNKLYKMTDIVTS